MTEQLSELEQAALDAALADFDRSAEIVLTRWRAHLAEADMTGIIWKSTPEAFVAHLEGWIGRNQPAFETAEGYCVAGPARLERRPSYVGYDVVRVAGAIFEPVADELQDHVRHAGDIQTIMLFGIIGNPDGTIAIVPDLREPRAAAYFESLCAELRRWAIAPAEPQLARALYQAPPGLTASTNANAHERTSDMEELVCRGTPAQVARRVLAVLAEDPDLLWITNAGGEAWTLAKIVNLNFWGRLKPDILESQELVEVMVLRGNWPVIGYITVEHLPDYVLVTAHNRWHSTEVDDAHNIRRRQSEDFTALAPIWERVKAELTRLGLVIEAEPAQVKRDEDAPKIDAPWPTGSAGKTAPIRNLGSELLQNLDKHFSEEDLRTLCFELGVDYENLPAQGKAGKARELIRHLERAGRIADLIDLGRKRRPKISWEDTSGASPAVAPE
jgi:hypothetical protein